ncbi:glutamic acid-rich protein-like [Protopterus annectens]|uniref:glutamic acid-rich protein-like n=1 Tax=Protopterus annectens TaxID=7888 RepID=UPI001CFB17AF|nr:glutamic acid-rich protein-like [Protopterus annectens]
MDHTGRHAFSAVPSGSTDPNGPSSGMKQSNGPMQLFQTMISQDSKPGHGLSQYNTYLHRSMFNYLAARNTESSSGIPRNCGDSNKRSQDIVSKNTHYNNRPLSGSVDCKFSYFLLPSSGESGSNAGQVKKKKNTAEGFIFTKAFQPPRALGTPVTSGVSGSNCFKGRLGHGQKSKYSNNVQASNLFTDYVPPMEYFTEYSMEKVMPKREPVKSLNLKGTDNQEYLSKQSVWTKEKTVLKATSAVAETVPKEEKKVERCKRRTIMRPRKRTFDFSCKDTETQEFSSKLLDTCRKETSDNLSSFPSAASQVHPGERESNNIKRRTQMPPRKLTFDSIQRDLNGMESHLNISQSRKNPADSEVSTSTTKVGYQGHRVLEGLKRRTLMPPRKLIINSTTDESNHTEALNDLKTELSGDPQILKSVPGSISQGKPEPESCERTLMPPRKLDEFICSHATVTQTNDVANEAESQGAKQAFSSRTVTATMQSADPNLKGTDNMNYNSMQTSAVQIERTADLQDVKVETDPISVGDQEYSSSKRRTVMPPRKLPILQCNDLKMEGSKGQETCSDDNSMHKMPDSDNSESSSDAMDSSDQEDCSQGTGNDPEDDDDDDGDDDDDDDEDEDDDKDHSSQDRSESGEMVQDEDYLLIDDKGIPYTISKTELVKSTKKEGKRDPRWFGSMEKPLDPRKIHYCTVCYRMFLYLSDLERHSITHSEQKPFQCKDCGKSFKRSSHLVRHKHIHTGEKPFLCAICQKGFRESGELLRHQRVHTGEKPYQCELCHMRFTERNTLRRHINRKHVKERLYQQNTDCAWDNPCSEVPDVNSE